MKIHSIEAKNFLKLKGFSYKASSPVTLFCGGNETGKTSVANAVSFALTGQPRRAHIEKKKDLRRLVSYGERIGKVFLDIEHEGNGILYERAVSTGNCSQADIDNPWIKACLDMHYFGNLAVEERRKLLFDAKPDFDRVAEILARTFHVDAKLIEKYKSWIETGFQDTVEKLREDVRELKGEWKGVTGEMWGSEKGETWEPRIPEKPETKGGEEALHHDTKMWNKEILALESGKGAARIAVQEAAGQAKMVVKLKEDAKLDVDYDDVFTKLETQYEEAREKAEKGRSKLEGLMTCPHCHKAIALSGNKVIPVKEANASVAERELALIDKKIKNTAAEAKAAQLARMQIEKMEHDVPDVSYQKEIIAGNDEAIKKYREMIAGNKELLGKIKSFNDAVSEARKIDKLAHKIHRLIASLVVFGKAMSGGGVPKILGVEVLTELNRFLQESAEASGWRSARITEDAEIESDGEPYFLLSESAQWKVDAQITMALAKFSGWGFAILDRLDVLEPKARGSALRWLKKESADMDSIIAMATLKEKPNIQSDWLDVYWMVQ